MRYAGNWLESYLKYTAETEPPTMFHEWVGISCIAAALQRKAWTNLGITQEIYPNMYIVLIGPAGTRKSTAMKIGENLLNTIGIPLAPSSVTREALIRTIAEGVQTTSFADTVFDHCSVTAFSSELLVFVNAGNPQMINDLTDFFDCPNEWSYLTKTQGHDVIKKLWFNFIAAVTPDLFQASFPVEAVGSGLSSRIIFVYEQQKQKSIAFPDISPETKELQLALVKDLGQIHQMAGEFQWAKVSKDRYRNWYEEMDGNPPKLSGHFAGYLNRRPTHLIKLAMIMSASRANDLTVKADDFDKALALLEKTELKMGRTFHGLGTARASNLTAKLQRYIEAKKSVTVRDLAIEFQGEFDNQQELNKQISLLRFQGFCSIEEDRVVFNKDSNYGKKYGNV